MARLVGPLRGHKGQISAVLFLADSRIAVSGSRQHQGSDQTVRFWDIATGQEAMSFTGGKGGVHSLALSHTGKLVAVGGGGMLHGNTWIYDHDIYLLDSETGRAQGRLEGQGFIANDLAFTMDDKYLIAGSFQKENSPGLRVYGIEDGVSIPRFGLETSSVSCLAVSPDGTLVVGGTTACEGEPCLRLWNVVTGEHVSDFSGYRGTMHDITFSTDGRFVLTVGNEITMWDMETISKVKQTGALTHEVQPGRS